MKPKTRKLTEPEAWRLIAEHYFGRTDDMTSTGLCEAVDTLSERDLITNKWWGLDNNSASDVRKAMLKRIEVYLRGQMWAYSYHGFMNSLSCDGSREARNARGMAALWLALEAEAEERE